MAKVEGRADALEKSSETTDKKVQAMHGEMEAERKKCADNQDCTCKELEKLIIPSEEKVAKMVAEALQRMVPEGATLAQMISTSLTEYVGPCANKNLQLLQSTQEYLRL